MQLWIQFWEPEFLRNTPCLGSKKLEWLRGGVLSCAGVTGAVGMSFRVRAPYLS